MFPQKQKNRSWKILNTKRQPGTKNRASRMLIFKVQCFREVTVIHFFIFILRPQRWESPFHRSIYLNNSIYLGLAEKRQLARVSKHCCVFVTHLCKVLQYLPCTLMQWVNKRVTMTRGQSKQTMAKAFKLYCRLSTMLTAQC